MVEQPNQQIRNDNLRLILSSQEAGFIDSRLHEARNGIRQNLIVGLSAAGAILAMTGLIVFGGFPSFIVAIFGIAMVFAVVTVLVCLVNALGATFSLRRFRSYQDDHDKFLKRYRREL